MVIVVGNGPDPELFGTEPETEPDLRICNSEDPDSALSVPFKAPKEFVNFFLHITYRSNIYISL